MSTLDTVIARKGKSAAGYPGIRRACFLIALDNGGINRDRSEAQWDREFARWIGRRDDKNALAPIDAWLASLTDEALDTVCCGEHSEVAAAMRKAPPFTDDLLNNFFDEVC